MRFSRLQLCSLLVALIFTPLTIAQVDSGFESTAVWAGGSTKNALQWTGSNGSASGRLHSNSDLKIGGNGHTFIGGATSVGDFSSGGNQNSFEPEHETVEAEVWPLPFVLEDYQPGGRAALEAGDAYYDMSDVCSSKNKWSIGKKDDPVAAGLYWVPCEVDIHGPNLSDQFTVVSDSRIKVSSSSNSSFTSFIDGVLFLTSTTQNNALHVSGSDISMEGYFVAQNSDIKLSGSRFSVLCGVYGNEVQLSGSNMSVDGAECGLLANTAPIADAASYQLNEDTPLSLLLTGSDANNDVISFTIVDAPANGQLTGTAPDLTYTPGENFTGTDQFTFIVSDDELDSNLATIDLAVTPLNDAPVAIEQSIVLNEDESVEIVLSGFDVDGDALTFSLTGFPSNGTLINTGVANTYLYAPNDNYSGLDSFQFTANDGIATSLPATILLDVSPVNDAPVASNLALQLLDNETINFVLPAVDPDGDALSFQIAALPDSGQITGTAPVLSYTPAAGFDGLMQLVFIANDGQLDSNVGEINFTITRSNSAPIPDPAAITTDEDTPATITLTATDPEGDTVSFRLETLPRNGVAELLGNQLTYTPGDGYFGTDSIAVIASDSVLDSDVLVIPVVVNELNSAPVANSMELETEVATPLDILLTAVDENQDALEFSILQGPENGELSGTAPNLVYTPANEFDGVDTFTFSVSDGIEDSEPATVTITVSPANRAPIAFEQTVNIEAGDTIEFTLTGEDPDGDELTFRTVSTASEGTLTKIAEPATYRWEDESRGDRERRGFYFVVNDGELDSERAFLLILTEPNAAPVGFSFNITYTANGESQGLYLPGTDADGDELTWEIFAQPVNGTLSGTPRFLRFTPFVRTDTVVRETLFYRIFDEHGRASPYYRINMTINPIPPNEPPVATDLSLNTTDLEAIDITLEGIDPEGGPVSFAVTTSPTTGTLSGVAPDLVYTPVVTGANYLDTFEYTVTDDDGAQDVATVSIGVNASAPVNSPPIASIEKSQKLTLGQVVKLIGTGFDTDGDSLSYQWSILEKPAGSAVELRIPVDSLAEITPDQLGQYRLGLIVNDGVLDSNLATAEVFVEEAAIRPIAVARYRVGYDSLERNSYLLDPVGSFDPTTNSSDGLLYSWSVIQPTSANDYTLRNLSQGRALLTMPPVGAVVELVVTSNGIDSLPYRFEIAPDAENPPIISLSAADEIPLGSSTDITANLVGDQEFTSSFFASYPYGNSIELSWTVTDRPANSVGELIASSQTIPGPIPFSGGVSVTQSFTPDVPGSYTLQLTADNGVVNGTATDYITILVFSADNTAPVAVIDNAGSNQINLDAAPVAISLNGSASSDSDGDDLSYEWTLEKPFGSVAVLSGGDGANPTFSADAGGTYRVKLRVNDGQRFSTEVERVFVAAPSAGNTAPIANPGSYGTWVAGELNTLDGYLSSDADGDALRYAWEVISVPEGSNKRAGNLGFEKEVSQVLYATDVQGRYVFQLTVRDWNESSAPVSVAIDVIAANRPPTASILINGEFTPDALATAGEAVTLQAQSFDPDGDSISYQWDVVSSPAGSNATLSAPTASETSFTVDTNGTSYIRLITSDGIASRTRVVAITTLLQNNRAPVAIFPASASGALGDVLTLDGSASFDPDGDQTLINYKLIFASDARSLTLYHLGINNQLVASSDAPGIFRVQVLLSDGQELSEPAIIDLYFGDGEPVARISANSDIQLPPGKVELNGKNSVDSAGNDAYYLGLIFPIRVDAVSFDWSIESAPAGSSPTLTGATTNSPELNADVVGEYVVKLIVSDAFATSAPAFFTVNVAGEPNEPPVAEIQAADTGLVGESLSFSGSGSSDPDADDLTYSWSLVQSPSGSVAAISGNGASVSFVPDVEGDYEVQLIVNDGRIDSAPVTATVAVSDTPAVIVDAVIDFVGVEGNDLLLSATGSTSSDNTALNYEWSVFSAPTGSNPVISDVSASDVRIALDLSGDYEIAVLVSNAAGFSDSNSYLYSYTTTNQLPVASFNFLPAGSINELVEVDGSASSDPDGDTLIYKWEVVSRPEESVANIADTGAQASFYFDIVGDYIVELVVSDGQGESSPVRRQISYSEADLSGTNVTITYPTLGALLPMMNTPVVGTFVSAVSKPSLVVNDREVCTDNGVFVYNELPLATGLNIITAEMPDGNPASVEENVLADTFVSFNTDGEQYFVFDMSDYCLTGPGNVAIELVYRSPLVEKIELDVDDDGTADFTLTDSNPVAVSSFSNLGINTITATAFLTDGATTSRNLFVVVRPVETERVAIERTWMGFLKAFESGDMSKAVSYFAADQREQNLMAFQNLDAAATAYLISAFATFAEIDIKEVTAVFGVQSEFNNQTTTSLVTFVKDVFGVWRIFSF